MSTLLKRNLAEKIAFKYNPKDIRLPTSEVAKDFIKLQTQGQVGSDFQIAEVVAQTSGVAALRKENIEKQVEDSVLDRLKEMEEQAYRQAYDLGLTEGAEKAFAEQKDVLAEKLGRFDQLLNSIENMKTEILKENESEIIKLIYKIAVRIAMREISLQQDPILAMLNELVAEVQGANKIHIKLNPSDAKFVEELRAKKVKDIDRLDHVKLQDSNDVTPGGCFIETNFGEIDATIEQRVTRAWEALSAKLPAIQKGNGPT